MKSEITITGTLYIPSDSDAETIFKLDGLHDAIDRTLNKVKDEHGNIRVISIDIQKEKTIWDGNDATSIKYEYEIVAEK